jgi:hypothetical protein
MCPVHVRAPVLFPVSALRSPPDRRLLAIRYKWKQPQLLRRYGY